MPSSISQASLIRETYRRAGLDPVKDRCQYFECHGTGTAAGDPVEARAIMNSIFSKEDLSSPEVTDPLYIGSIKTVIGHLEGCAGLAGLLKVVLAIKHRTIPPNRLINELNPDIELLSGKWQIPTSALPWPEPAPGVPLRASVNSFGFGGTNAHAIIESYEPTDNKHGALSDSRVVGPFVLSGHSGISLLENARNILRFLQENPRLNLGDLSWIPQKRRTAHRFKISFSAQTREALVQNLQKFIADHSNVAKDQIGNRHQPVNPTEIPGILGVFTGQGAQWPAMGHGLIEKCPAFRQVLEECDSVLQALPDAPSWSLVDELTKEASVSRLDEAAISQPLCTAIQLRLTKLLYRSGVHFDAVVGHSSGEIVAVYACGIITAAAAMQIAYYRGKYAHLARGADGQDGAMIAVGLSYREAKEFCQRPSFHGRLCVAASNAPQSSTLSGDADVVQNAKKYFNEENIFARVLKVDTAYHSHHMKRCAAAYLESITACDIQVQSPRNQCIWNSSVRGDTELLHVGLESLKGPYWVENMIQTVFFSQAIKSAIWHGGPFDLAIEVGPHPALKGPTEQNLTSVFGSAPAYTGTLHRGNDDVDAIHDGFGFVWTHLGPDFVDFDGFRQCFLREAEFQAAPPALLKDLPPYAWDHDRSYWRESRISARFRTDNDHPHVLLGRRTPDDTERELRWRNVLRLAELPWLQGHRIMGEVFLPGTFYVSLALQAGRVIAAGRSVRLFEVQNVHFRRPTIVMNTREGHEALFTVHVQDSPGPTAIIAQFSFSYSPDERSGPMIHTCDGQLVIHLGEPSADELPPRGPSMPYLLPVDIVQQYEILEKAGIFYSGLFNRLKDGKRRRDYAVSSIEWFADELPEREGGLLHPALLDVSLQGIFLAHADPTTKKFPTPLLPVSIKRMAIATPDTQWARTAGGISADVESRITSRSGLAFQGDFSVYNSSSGATVVQTEGVSFEPFEPATEAQDRQVFFTTQFTADPSFSLTQPQQYHEESETVAAVGMDCERLVLFYMQRILDELRPSEVSCLRWYQKRMIENYQRCIQVVRDETHPMARSSWLNDQPTIVDTIRCRWPDQIDVETVYQIGEKLVDVLRGKFDMLEILMKDDLVGRLYRDACGASILHAGMMEVLQQISSKFPKAKYLEIGAGTGSTTQSVFRVIQNAFDSYTYTDISPGFFDNARQMFADRARHMIFQTLNVEQDVVSQGFAPHTYDVVVASNVLHATANITTTLQNARRLLKPGGFLLLVEITGLQMMRPSFCMGGLPGWWLGAADGRHFHPGLWPEEWDRRLQSTGFSGLDLIFQDVPDPSQHTMSFLASQAVSETVLQLREPLGGLSDPPSLESLLVIGGTTLTVSKVVTAIQRLVPPDWRKQVIVASDIEEIDFSRISSRMDVLCLQELDRALFSDLVKPKIMKALQALFGRAQNVLWVTKSRRADDPRLNMVVGMARAICKELPHINLQSLDLDSIAVPQLAARTIIEALIRLKVLSTHDHGEDPLLWTIEPELIVSDSHTLIARVRPDQERNDRYNAAFRPVLRPSNSTVVPVRVVRQRNKLALAKSRQQINPSHDTESEYIQLKVQYSLTLPCEQAQGGYHLILGHHLGSPTPVLAVSVVAASIVSVRRQETISIGEEDCNPAILQRVCDRIFLMGLFRSVPDRSIALLYNPSERFASIVAAEASRCGIAVLFACPRGPIPKGWIRIHPQSSVHALTGQIPRETRVLVNCSSAPDALGADRLQPAMPFNCTGFRLDSRLFQQGINHAQIAQCLHAAYQNISHAPGPPTGPDEIEILEIRSLSRVDASIQEHAHIISWETTDPLDVIVPPLNCTDIFHGDKTYLMVGMAGGLGLSICEWALQHGAKELVITSRNPTIDPQWLEHARQNGAKVHAWSMDVTNHASVESVIHRIKKSLPPLGGVCNAAMVLTDRMFIDMNAEAMNTTLKPKVDGSVHLDRLCADMPLDFFIMLSSVATIVGTEGQANYHAANMFMTALAAQRRQRGLAASVVHVGVVSDVGYVRRLGDYSLKVFSRLLLGSNSEIDVHHAIGEAIQCSRPDCQGSYEVGLGIEPLKQPPSDDRMPTWLMDPRFSHYLPTREVSQGGQNLLRAGPADVKAHIQQAATEAEAVALMQEAFSARLQTMMQLPSNSSIDVNLPLTELGIDSLVAVEIRTWFLKEFGVDIPILKIQGREPIAQMCTNAAMQLLAKGRENNPSGIAIPGVESSPLSSLDTGRSLSSASTAPEPTESSLKPGDVKYPFPEKDGVTGMDRGMEKSPVDVDEDDLMQAPDMIQTEQLSRAQSRVYTHSQLLQDPTSYSLMIHYEMKGELDVERLQIALTITMQHHEALRTCFFSRPGVNQPMQGILAYPVRRFKHVPNAKAEDIFLELKASRARVWNLAQGETLGLTILSQTAHAHTIILAYHHLVIDATGMRTFIRDLDAAYRMQPLRHQGGTYIDYIRKQLHDQQPENLQRELAMWRQEYASIPEVLPVLPMVKQRDRPEDIYQGVRAHVRRNIGAETANAIKRTCRTLQITACHFHLAVFQVLLAQSLGIEDVCIGVADANRLDGKFVETVGFFLNFVPVRSQVPGGAQFAQVAQNAARNLLRALEHSSMPLDMILDHLNPPRSSSYSPLFQAAFDYRMGVAQKIPFGGNFLTIADGSDARHPYDMTLGILEYHQAGFMLEVICPESLYDTEVCESLLDMYLRVVDTVTTDMNTTIAECQIHDRDTVLEAVKLGRGSQVNPGGPMTIPARFQGIHQVYPERLAAVDGTSSVTYAQLATRVQSIASALVAAGSEPGSRIAVLCMPSVDAIASLLAILDIGAIYVPLDVGYPSSRHAAIVSSCQPSVLLAQEATVASAEQLVSLMGKTQCLLRLEHISEITDVTPYNAAAQPDSPAILLYTSGSTGTPKGVLLSQRSLAHWVAATIQTLDLEATAHSILQQSALGFDMSLIQIFWALCTGGNLVIVPEESRRDPWKITELIQRHQITVTMASPSQYDHWLRYCGDVLKTCSEWRLVVLGAEALHRQLMREFQRLELPALSFFNFYGPTETTIAATVHPLSVNSPAGLHFGSMVGKALPNYSVCIIDSSCHPLPVRFSGEICIGGAGVALGYWALPDETAQRFISDPTKTDNSRWYRTGDSGQLAPDGSLIYLGRIEGDTQVKLRGLRIELEEVERALLSSGEGLISAVVVSMHNDALIAYATASSKKQVDPDAVQRILAGLPLPQYMRPARLHIVDDIPRTSRGKVDRKAVGQLLLSEAPTAGGGSTAPLGLRELELKLLWDQVLPGTRQDLTGESDFFLVGGNSLYLTRLQHLIKESMGIYIPAPKLYSACTLERMAALVYAQRGDQVPDEKIDWERETAVPESLLAAIQENGSYREKVSTGEGIEVLLTGAASFLGSSILNALLRESSVRRIHCVAIPPDANKLPSSDKVVEYSGTLSSPTLSLNPSECRALQEQINVVIHAGANGHCLNNFRSVQKPNVQSTQFLISLCLPCKIPFLYVSSNRVPLLTGSTSPPPGSVQNPPPAVGAEGFTASKWISEHFLENVTQLTGIPIEIHRPCVAVGDQAPVSDAVNAMLRYSILLKAAPVFPAADGYIDFKGVEEVAGDMASSALALTRSPAPSSKNAKAAGICFRHHSGGRKVPINALAERLQELHAVQFESIKVHDWLPQAKRAGLEAIVETYMRGVLEQGKTIYAPYLGEAE